MAGASSLPLAGVEAVVEGLQQFQGDIRQMNTALDSLRPKQTLLQQAFEGAWEAVGNLGREILNVAEVALGKILGDAIEWVIGKLGELVSATIETGSQFQTLQIRLNGLNLQDAINSGMEYSEAMQQATELTKKQLDWIQMLGAATPFDPAEIANVYTLARSYGFADEAAARLTKDITAFTAGMGLGNDVLERIIQNLGQMVQRGKITSTEIRDLARGAYMPIADVLDRIAKKMGITVKQLTKEISKPGGGVPAQQFIDAFMEMTEQEPRFVGAAGRLARALVPAIANVKELFTSLAGKNILTPVFDVIGEKIASITDQFVKFNEAGDIVKTEKWDKIVAVFERIGRRISKIAEGLLGLAPDASTLTDKFILAVSGIADWLDLHGPGIVQFFKDLGTIVGGVADKIRIALSMGQKPAEAKKPGQPTGAMGDIHDDKVLTEDLGKPAFGQGFLDVVQKIADFINTTLIPALIKIQVWFEVNKPLIDEFWSTVWQIISDVISDIFGGEKKQGGTDVLTIITNFMKYVVENKDQIVKWVEILWSAFVVWQALATIANIVISITLAIAGFVLAIVGIPTMLAMIGAATAIAVVALTALITIAYGIIMAWVLLRNNAELLRQTIQTVVDGIKRNWEDLKANIYQVITQVLSAIVQGDWYGAGRAIINGVISGVQSAAQNLMNTMARIAGQALAAAKNALGIKSPSTVFENVGRLTMEGFAQGITKAAGLAVGAMQGAVSAVMVPAVSSMAAAGGNTYNNSRTANLTINSNAGTENVVADFAMMESLMGA